MAAKYDSTKMRSVAAEIRAEAGTFEKKKQEIDNIVTILRNNWEDQNNTNFTQKYNNEAKVSAENIKKLMDSYASLLETSADAWDKVDRTTAEGLQ